MINPLLSRLSRLGSGIQALEQSLFRKEIVLPFLLGRFLLIVAMVLGFSLALSGTP